MALTKLLTDLIDGSLGTDWQSSVKTADFTAVAGQGYFVDTTSAAITVTLPSSPSAGDYVTIVDYAGTADTNNITITSSDNINGAADDVVINYERGGVSMVYVDATQGWIAYNATNETATSLNTALPNTFSADYLVVAGGGSGHRSDNNNAAGGGGAGGLRTSYGSTSGGGASAESSLTLSVSANYTVTVGAGGADISTPSVPANSGSNSVFSTITSVGGGGGGGIGGGEDATSGGSGGGGGGYNSAAGASGTVNQGYAGGNGSPSTSSNFSERNAGGGGGAGANGSNGSTSSGGAGGAGLNISITGSSVGYAGGGSGGNKAGNGIASTHGGGTGAGTNTSGTSGSPNTGGGGGGGGVASYAGNAGGSGIVILRYPSGYSVAIGSGLTGSTTTDGSDKVTTFTAGTGIISFS